MKKSWAAIAVLGASLALAACDSAPSQQSTASKSASSQTVQKSSSKASAKASSKAAASKSAASSKSAADSKSSREELRIAAGKFAASTAKKTQGETQPAVADFQVQQKDQAVKTLTPVGAAMEFTLKAQITQTVFGEGHQKLEVTVSGLNPAGQKLNQDPLYKTTLSIADDQRNQYQLDLPIQLQVKKLKEAAAGGVQISLTLLVESMKDGSDVPTPLLDASLPFTPEK